MPLPDLHNLIHWVDSDRALDEACAVWRCADAIAVDTEFVRRRTYYPIPALLQVYDGARVGVVDPLAIGDWSPLAELLAGPVVKVLHACSEDLEVFSRLLGVVPAPLFDTQIAAGLCGLRPSMGYHNLVQELCGVALPKDETQSDWLVRPLSDGQLTYAASDVYYLYAVYRQLRERLAALGREAWVLEDGAAVGHGLSSLTPPEEAYLRLKGAWRLQPPQLAVARALAAWRERMVRERDLPRNWLLKDAAILALAQRQPDALPALATVAELPPSSLRKFGAQLLQCIAEAAALPPGQWPPALPSARPDVPRQAMAQVEAAVAAAAAELGVASEVLVNRKQLTALAQSLAGGGGAALSAELGGWRAQVLAAALASAEQGA